MFLSQYLLNGIYSWQTTEATMKYCSAFFICLAPTTKAAPVQCKLKLGQCDVLKSVQVER